MNVSKKSLNGNEGYFNDRPVPDGDENLYNNTDECQDPYRISALYSSKKQSKRSQKVKIVRNNQKT